MIVVIASGGKSDGVGRSILLRLQEVHFVTVVMALFLVVLWVGKDGFVGPNVSEDCLVGV